ncbi:hypothetical protein D9619_002549 [Psilocybe cf. subviscida]|uniref:Ribosomal eL28/Mak16 domain-containing protein n=1 Tax=Psilocybe cf. subviscida TaxID=2480587 RepID=A0A8H5AVY0_9AGAR|nr:hypothetical protein D9619_002549 [Psilocybe cf. subviscida]
MSSDLQWLLLRNSNSFIVKRVPEGPVFSREPGNLLNLNSFKYSGLANSKTIAIDEKAGNIQVVTRKTKASPQAVGPAYATASVRPRSGGRRALGVAAAPAKRGYRPDLRAEGRRNVCNINPVCWSRSNSSRYLALSLSATAALARISALVAAQGTHKASPAKKLRGKKAAAAASTA